MPELEFTSQSVIDNKYATVLNGFHSSKAFGPHFRLKQLRNLYNAIRDNEQELKTALFMDLHRPEQETEVLEINQCLTEATLAIDNLEKWLEPEPIAGVFEDVRFASGKSVLRKTPYGTVLIIGPWNYPFLLIFAPVISAIAAGNSVLLKPSELCVNSTIAVTKVLESALDPTIFQIVQGGIEETTYLLEKKWDKIMLTGSPKVGKVVATAAAKNLTPVLLELGGKSPAIITAKADIPLAAKRLAWAKLVNAGQTCVAPDYIIIDSEVADEFTFHFKEAVKLFYPDMDAQSDSMDFAHILNERLFGRLEKLVSETKGYVWQWGEPNKETLFYPPTIVRNVSLDDSLMQEELFAPILPMIESDDILLAAPEIITDFHDHPLAIYLFTTDKEEQEAFLRHTRSGAVMINDALVQGGSTAIPFGGVGTSGVGRYHGKYGFDEFTFDRPVVSQPNWSEALLKARYPPYTESNAKMIKFVSRPQNYEYPEGGAVKRSFTLKSLLVSYVAAPITLGVLAIFVKVLRMFT